MSDGLPTSGLERVVAIDRLRWLIGCDAYRSIQTLVEEGARPLDAAVDYRDWLVGMLSDEVDMALAQWHLFNRSTAA